MPLLFSNFYIFSFHFSTVELKTKDISARQTLSKNLLGSMQVSTLENLAVDPIIVKKREPKRKQRIYISILCIKQRIVFIGFKSVKVLPCSVNLC